MVCKAIINKFHVINEGIKKITSDDRMNFDGFLKEGIYAFFELMLFV